MEIKDYSDYLIYHDGRVFSKRKNKFLKTWNNQGYYEIDLHKNKKRKHFKIHRLVGLHYLPKVEGKDYIDHINGDKLNNHVNNLRWTTKIENENNFQKLSKNNTLGFKNICYIEKENTYQFQKNIYRKRYRKKHKNLNELLWFKFVLLIIHHA